MKKPKEPYLKIADHILSIPNLAAGEKMLLAHIYSFGAKGCWQSNKTLAEILTTSPPTITRWLRRIRPYTYVKNPKGYYRTIWAKGALKNDQVPAQTAKSDSIKSARRPDQIRSTTINNTITENNNRTTASPSPLPAPGQAPATLQYRKQVAVEQIEKFKALFGRAAAAWTPLTPQQFQQRRAEQLAALRATTLVSRDS